MHEMGHNIEQTFSMNLVDHHLLAGVPNNAFTEALAMVQQQGLDIPFVIVSATIGEELAVEAMKMEGAVFGLWLNPAKTK